MELLISCPVCSKNDFQNFLTVKDHSISKENFTLQKCKNCNLIATNPKPDKEQIGKYYISENYISHSGKSHGIIGSVYLLARKITLRWKYNSISKYFSKPGTVLDYGCGTGEFLNTMKQQGWNISGVEPSDTAREKATFLTSTPIHKELDITNTKFDVITLWHVLEHIHDLNETIQKIKTLLSDSGIIVVAVPNPNSLDCEKYKEYWAGYDVPRHLWHFTQDTISKLMHANQLKVIEKLPMKLDSFYVSMLSEQYLHRNENKFSILIKAIKSGINSNMQAAKNGEYSSLIYIIRKG